MSAVERVVRAGRFVLGPEVEAFESEWADAAGARHAVGVASGLDALIIALEALGVGPGDEVLLPSNTYIATWLAVTAVGAVPVAVEPDPAAHLITPAGAEARLSPRTAALLPVHLYGATVDIAGFEALAARHSLALVFDAAQAHGAQRDGRPVGGRGTASAWSFYPGKNLGALGDGGAITTGDALVAERARLLRNYGSPERDRFELRGHNSRLDELQAALLRVKLPHLDRWNGRRREIAATYLTDLEPTGLVLPIAAAREGSVWHLFVVGSRERDALRARLDAQGVETLIHYPVPPHRQAAFADHAERLGPLPVADELAASVLSLPIGPHLTDSMVADVVEKVLRATGGLG